MDKNISLKINNRTETAFGIASLGLAIISIVLFFVIVYQSAYSGQGKEILIGTIELIAILFALVGLVFGIIGETRRNKFKMTAHIGIGLNMLIGVFHVIVLVQGYSL